MSGILRHKFVVGVMCCLAAGWLVMAVNAEDRQGAKKIQSAPSAAKVSVQKVKPAVTKPMREIEQSFYPALTQFEKDFQEKLNERMEEEYIEVPLEEVINQFQEFLGVSLVISRRALDDEGITLDDLITVSIPEMSKKSALDLVLKPLDLTYVVERDLVKITTKYQAHEMLKTRIYPVADYCKTPDDYFALQLAIQNATVGRWRSLKTNAVPGKPVNDGGLRGGGRGLFQVTAKGFVGQSISHPRAYVEGDGGTISVVLQSQSLVISQTYQAHEKIVELLTLLRQARADQQ